MEATLDKPLTRWPHQVYAQERTTELIESGIKRSCVTSPTGGGKSRMMIDLMEWAIEQGWSSVLYTNRQMLTEQMIRVLTEHGMPFGVRAAAFEEYYDPNKPIQIAMSPTENARVLKKRKSMVKQGMTEQQVKDRYSLHPAELVIIDELHMQSSGVIQTLIDEHLERGGYSVGYTATPLGIRHMADELVVAGTVSELRKCGALVPAHIYAPDELDTRHVKRECTGEDFTYAEIKKIWSPQIFGRVYDHWKIYNPDQRATIGFAPGVKESLWFAQQFHAKGVAAAHIDGNDVWVDGKLFESDRAAREDVRLRSKAGEMKLVWNRFVLREALDWPWLYHLILATPIGSLKSYIQVAGRVLRRSEETPDAVVIQDHGGNFWRHGSPNVDRDWLKYWELPERVMGQDRIQQIRDRKTQEPIVCPKCKAVRANGRECPKCQFVMDKKTRLVLQVDGTLKEMHGDIVKPQRIKQNSDTQELWKKMFFRARNSRNRMTFQAAMGLFMHENWYYPPRTLDYMPKNDLDWFLPVADVTGDRVKWPEKQTAKSAHAAERS